MSNVMRIEMLVSDVLSLFSSSGRLIESVEEFNSVCEHIVLLLEEAEGVFHRESYSTTTFLAITAIEETAKAHLGMFTGGEGKSNIDKFYSSELITRN